MSTEFPNITFTTMLKISRFINLFRTFLLGKVIFFPLCLRVWYIYFSFVGSTHVVIKNICLNSFRRFFVQFQYFFILMLSNVITTKYVKLYTSIIFIFDKHFICYQFQTIEMYKTQLSVSKYFVTPYQSHFRSKNQ